MTKAIDFSPINDQMWPKDLSDLAGGFATKLNVYRTMAHHPSLVMAWANLREHVVNQSVLGPEFSEVVILRTGVNLGSDYEWAHHVSRGRALGMSDARIHSLRGSADQMEANDAIFATAVDMLLADKKLASDAIPQLAALVGKKGVLDVIATVGFYSTLGYMLNSFNTPIDDQIAAELEAQPLTGD